MCSLSVKPSVSLSSPNSSSTISDCQPSSMISDKEYSVTISQFWSRKADWTPGCSYSSNIQLGDHACQLHVYPAGSSRAEEKLEKQIVEEVEDDEVNTSHDAENFDVLVLEGEINCKEKVEYESESKKFKVDESKGNGLCVELVNLTSSDLVIQGELSIGFVTQDLKQVDLPSATRVVIFKIGSDEEEMLQLDKTGEMSSEQFSDQDLNIKLDFNVVSVKSPVTEVSKSSQLDISEMNQKVAEINPMLAELRDQFQAEMESMQDILLETPLSAEVSDLKEQVSQMKTEIINEIKIDVNNKFQSLKESVLPTIYTELAAMKKDLTNTLGIMQQATKEQATSAASQMSATRQDILFLKDNVQSTSSNSTRSAISELQVQLEMLQDSVLSAVSTPARQAKPSYPECPYCMEELEPPAKIYQCLSGHLICESCQSKPAIKDCPSCHQQISGRNRGLETFLQRLAGQ